MPLADLFGELAGARVRGDPSSALVSGVELDSRRAGPGTLFCCVPGAVTDGHLHAGEAVRRGATGLVCEHFLDLDVPQARVASGEVRPAMARVAAAFYGHPADSLAVVGVTGTNGKTTVTHLLGQLLDGAGLPTEVIGTLDGARTTPESPDLQRRLARCLDEGARAAAMEVSSHALTQHRVDGIRFAVAAFTNLSRDHLDFHGTMDAYFAAKCRLFDEGTAARAVVNVDDPWGARLADRVGPDRLVAVHRSDAGDLSSTTAGSSFRWRGHPVALPLVGTFNVENALVAAAVAVELGVEPGAVAAGLSRVSAVPGRMQVVGEGAPVTVVVDYAHTPAGLEAALAALRAVSGPGRLVCVFGCGGDRDRGKRPEMGAVAAHHADVVVLTSDNPRSEGPVAIIDEIRAGMGPDARPLVEADRDAAIRAAVDLAADGDVVLVAGKGHETTQTGGGTTRPFDDRVAAARALAGRDGGGDR